MNGQTATNLDIDRVRALASWRDCLRDEIARVRSLDWGTDARRVREHVQALNAASPYGSLTPEQIDVLLGVPDERDSTREKPQPPFDRDGLEAALQAAGRTLRGNRRASWYLETEIDGAWVPCTEGVLSTLMEDLADACEYAKGRRAYPWRIPGAGLERRLLLAVAKRHEEDGDRDWIRQATHDWAQGRTGFRGTLSQVITSIGLANKYEGKGRQPAAIADPVKAELRDLGWEYRVGRPSVLGSARRGRNPQMLWHSPDQCRPGGVSLRPSAFEAA